MNETDIRSLPLRVLCTVTTNAISELIEFSKVPEFIDKVTTQECIEYLYGAVLVACQAYAIGVVSDVNRVRASFNKNSIKKLEPYKNEGRFITAFSYIELINALANHFKHNEEWGCCWPSNETTKVLRYFDINEKNKFPLSAGITIMLGESNDLRLLCQILEEWRDCQIEDFYYKSS